MTRVDSLSPVDRALSPVEGFTALLVLSFGGPDGPGDVRPFLENVTRGRGIPPERLEEVVQHYLHFGGVSPINRLNLDMIDAVRAELARRGRDLPIYYGNRNWHPYAADTLREMLDDGHERILVFPTSAWGGYSGCRQYHEDIAAALAELGESPPAGRARFTGRAPFLAGRAPSRPVLRKLPQYATEPGFLDAAATAVRRALAELGEGPARLVFTAHSVPESADRAAGPPAEGGRLYSRQVAAAAAEVARRLGIDDYDVVWQSRSGPPRIPWLEPDICDHLRDLHSRGETRVVVFPIGFISDHLEVIWDLDAQARELADSLGMDYVRAGTVGTDPAFIAMVADLVERYADGGGDLNARGCGDNGAPCAPDCCLPPSRPR